MVIRARREQFNDNRPNDKCQPGDRVRPDKGSTSPQAVDEPDAECLAYERDDRVTGLQPERCRGVDADGREDLWGVVLNNAYSGHLDAL